MKRYGARPGVRFVFDPVRQTHAVLYPEGVLLVNETAADIMQLCDGQRTQPDIQTALSEIYETVDEVAVTTALGELAARHILDTNGTGHPVILEKCHGESDTIDPAPVGMLAELTHRCPLRCTYCANPLQLTSREHELSTAQWIRVIGEARQLGVLQLHLSGGEPLLRQDLTSLIRHARELGLYTNLITSGIPLDEHRLQALTGAGLDHVQLSIQDSDPGEAKAVTGIGAHEGKLTAAYHIRRSGLPFTINVVLHRGNIGRVRAITELAVSLGACRLELAHTQFYGWAWRNRNALLPSQAQIEAADAEVVALQQNYGSHLEIVYVRPDYHTGVAKPCMNGWGTRQLVVTPSGEALPCLSAAQIHDLPIPNARETSLREIWCHSEAFSRFRGTRWLPEPCQSCTLRDIDFGGCRCQAYQILGDAAATDPVCHLSPRRDEVDRLLSLQPAGLAILRTKP